MRSILRAVTYALLVVSITAICGAAAAQDGYAGQDVTRYKFDDDIVPGTLIRPDGTLVPGRRRGPSRSLIKVRAQFVPEMLLSVEDI